MVRLAALVLAGLAVPAASRPLTHEEQLALYGPARPQGRPVLRYRQPGGLKNASETLRQAAAKRGLHVGYAGNYDHLQAEPQYRALAAAQYDLVTAENECKFHGTEPQQNQFTVERCAFVLQSIIKTSGVGRGHNFVWGTDNPSWLTDGHFSLDQLVGIMENHISKVAGAFRGQLLAWDVVNEPVCDSCTDSSPILKPVTPWYPAVEDYLAVALHAARKADPSAQLFINEYGGEGLGGKSDRVYAMAKDLLARGAPLDGIGLQMHISVDAHPSADDVAANIARLGALGLKVHITEMDVKCPPPCGADRLDLQAKVYGDMLEACLKNSNCKSFQTWGVTDKFTWLWDFENPEHKDMQPLPFDANYQPKPAFYEMLAVLQASDRVSDVVTIV